jgi:hypothetical protein
MAYFSHAMLLSVIGKNASWPGLADHHQRNAHTVADIAQFGWIARYQGASLDKFPAVSRWHADVSG